MLQKITFLSLFFLCSSSIFAQRYLTEIFNEVQVDNSVIYGQNVSVLNLSSPGQSETINLEMDVYTPVGDAETNRPVVLFLHGGDYLPPYLNGSCLGTRQDNAAVEICTRLAKMGYVAASIDYRLGWNPLAAGLEVRLGTLLKANYRGVQDTRTCLRYFRKTEAENGNPWGIDPQRAVVWGDGIGGSVALTAATVNSFDELISAGVVFGNNGFFLNEEIDGDIYGTLLTLSPDNPTDTLSIPNHVGYSSDFNLSVNNSGYLIADEWLNAGDLPMISFHGTTDAFYPYADDVIIPPTISLWVLDANGSLIVQQLANGYGNNQVFINANIQDVFTDTANELNEGLEGLYPFIVENDIINPPFNLISMPWNWVTNTPPDPPMGSDYVNCNFDENLALSKIDSMLGYFAPRAFAAMCFGCQEFQAEVFLDENTNGVFDGNDFALPNIIAEFQPDNLHANSDNNGIINTLLPTGNYTMTITPPMYHQVMSTPYPVVFSIDAAGVSLNNVPIAVVPIPNINDLSVSLLPLDAPKPGFENSMKIVYKNQGTTTQSGTITLNFDDQYTVLETTPSGSVVGTEITWETGNLAPFETGEITLKFALPATTSLNEVLISDVSFTSSAADETPVDNFDQIQQIVIGSFDPNDKAVNPAQLSMDDAAGRYLTYLIRFQNTGTAPAVNVRVEDTLSQYLDINTLEILDVSHDYRMEITGDKNIAWYFDDIFLPDSTNNEPESHGHIAFRVKTNIAGDLPISIDNQAFIYFDFNEAILTNVAKAEFLINGIQNRNSRQIPLQLFPNPTQQKVNLESVWPISVNKIEVEILDISGKIVHEQQVFVQGQNIQTTLDLGNLPTGIYQIRLFEKEFSAMQRVVKIE